MRMVYKSQKSIAPERNVVKTHQVRCLRTTFLKNAIIAKSSKGDTHEVRYLRTTFNDQVRCLLRTSLESTIIDESGKGDTHQVRYLRTTFLKKAIIAESGKGDRGVHSLSVRKSRPL